MTLNFKYLAILVILPLVASGCTTASNQSTKPQVTQVLHVPTPPPIPKKKPSAKSSKPFHSLISKYAAENGVPINLAHAVVFSESTYRPNATGSVGEIGLMQLRLATARLVGYKGSAKGLYNPETNIKYGMKYLGKAHQLAGGSTCGTILRYNAGHGAKRMNPISQRYCNKVRKLL